MLQKQKSDKLKIDIFHLCLYFLSTLPPFSTSIDLKIDFRLTIVELLPSTLSYFSLSSSMSNLWPSASHRVDELPVPVCFSRSSRFWRRSIWTSALRRSVSPSKVDLNIKTTTTFGSELQKGPLWHDVLTFWICLRVNKKKFTTKHPFFRRLKWVMIRGLPIPISFILTTQLPSINNCAWKNRVFF